MPERKLNRNIIGLEPELAERGHIKTGGKGPVLKSKAGNDYQLPVRYEHFVITTMTRGKDGNFERDEALHKLLGDSPTSIPVRLLFNDPNLDFTSGYGVWDAKLKTWWCRGDGENAQRLQPTGDLVWINCPCELLGDKCKVQAKLRVIVDGAQGLGGVWTYITTSWNSTRAIAASIRQLMIWTGGHISGLPLRLVMRPKTVSPKGVTSTIQVVSLEYVGDMDQLRVDALNATKLQIGYEKQLSDIEKEMTAATADEEIITADDAAEFFPEETPEPEKEEKAARRGRPPKQPEQVITPVDPPPLVAPGPNGAPPPESEHGEQAGDDDDSSPF